jgi:ABC-2 type transport system ATP-binding protein
VQSGTDVLLTTQYLDEADHLAGQIVIIDNGRAVAAGTPAQLKQRIGGNVIEVRVRESRDVPTIAELLGRLSDGVAQIDEATRRVSVRIDPTADGQMTALQSLHATGVELDDVAMRQPNLDEVFLTLTGKRSDDDHDAAAARAA